MKIVKYIDDVFGMANLVPKRTGLSVDIWSEHKGCKRKVSHRETPRVKLQGDNYFASITIEKHPVIKAISKNLKHSEMKAIKEGMAYVGRNYDLFLRHYNDVDDAFDDEDLFAALRERGEFR